MASYEPRFKEPKHGKDYRPPTLEPNLFGRASIKVITPELSWDENRLDTGPDSGRSKKCDNTCGMDKETKDAMNAIKMVNKYNTKMS